MKEKIKKEKEELEEVAYQNGKLIVREQVEEVTGKKRKREDRFADFESLMGKKEKDEGEESKDAKNVK